MPARTPWIETKLVASLLSTASIGRTHFLLGGHAGSIKQRPLAHGRQTARPHTPTPSLTRDARQSQTDKSLLIRDTSMRGVDLGAVVGGLIGGIIGSGAGKKT